MRCATAAQIKAGKKQRGAPRNLVPREGTRVREIFDRFQSFKGRPFELRLNTHGDERRIAALKDFYGLDIRHIQRGDCRVGRPSLWLLAGEWFGRVYVDYVAQHLESLSRPTGNETAADSSAPQPTAAVSDNFTNTPEASGTAREAPSTGSGTSSDVGSQTAPRPRSSRCVVKNETTFAVTQASLIQAKSSSISDPSVAEA